jgi:hypothetical protein
LDKASQLLITVSCFSLYHPFICHNWPVTGQSLLIFPDGHTKYNLYLDWYFKFLGVSVRDSDHPYKVYMSWHVDHIQIQFLTSSPLFDHVSLYTWLLFNTLIITLLFVVNITKLFRHSIITGSYMLTLLVIKIKRHS